MTFSSADMIQGGDLPADYIFSNYRVAPAAYDEYFNLRLGCARDHVRPILQVLSALTLEELQERNNSSLVYLKRKGVTFAVADSQESYDRVLPLDLLPRLIPSSEWRLLERGILQRTLALNLFIEDVYSRQQIIRDGFLSEELLLSSPGFIKELVGVAPTGGIYSHISGIDLVRTEEGIFTVIEDNLRVPSGVSYVIENRQASMRYASELLDNISIEPVHEYPSRLASVLKSLVPWSDRPRIVVLTPGEANQAYFEHCFLARAMGAELVQPSDLFVENDIVFLKALPRPVRVDVVYRRVDDVFLDPTVLRSDSVVGVPGLLRSYASGRVVLVNSPGNGVADDKAIFSMVPRMIRYYLSEEPLLDQPETFICALPSHRKYVLQNLSHFVVKPVAGSGGAGIFFGPTAQPGDLLEKEADIMLRPRNFVAQPFVELSRVPTIEEGRVVPRRVDLRPFAVSGGDGLRFVLPGGLTRVAASEDSYLVNSSAGGGTKDTWVLSGDGV